MNNLGIIYARSDQITKDQSVAFNWYSKCVSNFPAFTPGVINLADHYISGLHEKNLEEAKRLLESIEDKDPDAKASLARLYESGVEGFNDPEKANQYRKDAADAGSVSAKRDLAKAAMGTDDARQLLFDAANSGDISCQNDLAKMALQEKEYVDAKYWLVKTAKQGDLEGRKLLIDLGNEVEKRLFG